MRIHPIDIWPNNRAASWFWFLLTMFVLIANIIQPIFIIRMCKGKKFCIDITSKTTFNVTPLKNYDDLKSQYIEYAKRAATALLSINPNGYDYPEILESHFNKSFKTEHSEKLKQYEKSLTKKNIYQKLGVSKAEILSKEEGNLIMVQFEGQLIRVGIDHNKAENYQGQCFKMDLYLVKNPNLLNNGEVKFLVDDYKLSIWDMIEL